MKDICYVDAHCPAGVPSSLTWIARAGSTGFYLLFLFNMLEQQHSHCWLTMDVNATHWGWLDSSSPHETVVRRIENCAVFGDGRHIKSGEWVIRQISTAVSMIYLIQ